MKKVSDLARRWGRSGSLRRRRGRAMVVVAVLAAALGTIAHATHVMRAPLPAGGSEISTLAFGSSSLYGDQESHSFRSMTF